MEYLKTKFSDKLAVTQLAVELIAIWGVSKVISQVIENNTESEEPTDKLRIKIGSWIIGFLVVDITTRYVSNAFSSVVEWYRDVRNELKEASEAAKEESKS